MNATMGEMSAIIPEMKESSIASETTGSAKMLAGKETNESTPVKYKRAGSTYICTEMVEAAIERMPNFSGIHLSLSSTVGEIVMSPKVASTDNIKDGS
jgi:hypothetical protein